MRRFFTLCFSATGALLLSGCSSSPAPTLGMASTLGVASRQGKPELLILPRSQGRAVRGLPRVHTENRGGHYFKGQVRVTDAVAGKVYVCQKNCKSVGSGWSLPQGLATDGTSIYVADTDNSRIVQMSLSGAVEAVLSDPGQYPAAVSVAPNGTVGVTNICSTGSCGQGNVVFYSKGATSPTSSACCLFARYYFPGFDAKGNFYADGTTSNGTVGIEQIANASTGGTTETNTGISNIVFPGGVQGGTDGTLYVDDQACPCVQAYALPGYGDTTIPLQGAVAPVSIAFWQKTDQEVWEADEGTGAVSWYGLGSHYGLHGGGPYDFADNFSEPIGIVVLRDGQY